MESRRDVFQAIADPTRRNILVMLSDSPKNLNSIAEEFDMTRQAISLHVKILNECGVLLIERRGRERHCSLQLETLREVADWLEPFKKLWESRFQQLDTLLGGLQSNDKRDE